MRHTTSCRVSSCKTMPYRVMSCGISWHVFSISCSIMTPECGTSPFLRRTQNCLRGSPKPPKRCWVPVRIKFGPKIAQNLSSQDPRRCTDAIRGRAALYVIQRIWSCINQNLNLPPHAAFRGQKTTFWISSFQFDARQSRAHCYLPQLLINNKRDRSLPNIEKLCKEQYFQKRLKTFIFNSFNADIKKINA